MAKVICFDIDGVLTNESDSHHEDMPGTYVYRTPNFKAREVMAQSMEKGWTVILYTGRKEEQRRLTENWLALHGFHYHFLFMNKPYYSIIIDDRSKTLEEFRNLLNESS